MFITVPFLVIEAPTLTVDQPPTAPTFENGAIPVQGATTTRSSVVVSAVFGTRPAGAGRAAARAATSAGPGDGRGRGDDGAFSTPYELTAGRWTITVTARARRARPRR